MSTSSWAKKSSRGDARESDCPLSRLIFRSWRPERIPVLARPWVGSLRSFVPVGQRRHRPLGRRDHGLLGCCSDYSWCEPFLKAVICPRGRDGYESPPYKVEAAIMSEDIRRYLSYPGVTCGINVTYFTGEPIYLAIHRNEAVDQSNRFVRRELGRFSVRAIRLSRRQTPGMNTRGHGRRIWGP